MRSNVAFAKYSYGLNIRRRGRSAVTVHWTEIAGGTLDPVTRARVGGVQTFASGTLDALGHETQATHGQRQHVEIEVGDLLLDVRDDAVVTHSSGTVTLDSLAGKNPEFIWSGRRYVQKELGTALASSWDVRIENIRIGRTLLLKRKA